MKAILEFNLPEENEEFQTAINANKYASQVDQILGLIRRKYKYEEHTPEITEFFHNLRDEIHEIVAD